MSANIFFDPWIGVNYGTKESIFKKKILILGDSHYCDVNCPNSNTCGERNLHENCTDFTTDGILCYLDQEIKTTWKKTYTTFINSMIGRDSSLKYKEEFFDSIVFYNYLQVAAGKTAGLTQNYDYTGDKHLRSFYEVLDKFLPDIVICWGTKVWNALPNDWEYGEAEKGKGILINSEIFKDYYCYPYKDKKILLIRVHHPSAGYDVEFHNKVFSELGII
jgi:hypothetical protein